MGMANKLQLP